jgi:hypothetical protein
MFRALAVCLDRMAGWTIVAWGWHIPVPKRKIGPDDHDACDGPT